MNFKGITHTIVGDMHIGKLEGKSLFTIANLDGKQEEASAPHVRLTL